MQAKQFARLAAAFFASIISSATALAASDAQFVCQSVSTAMTAGQSIAVTVTMQNTGTTTWTAGAGYKLGSQSPQDNWTWGTNRVQLPTSVAPGQTVAFAFNVAVLASKGTYAFQWADAAGRRAVVRRLYPRCLRHREQRLGQQCSVRHPEHSERDDAGPADIR